MVELRGGKKTNKSLSLKKGSSGVTKSKNKGKDNQPLSTQLKLKGNLEKATKEKSEEQEKLQALEKELDALKSTPNSSESEESSSAIEAQIKQKLLLLEECNETISKIQSDIDEMDIDENDDESVGEHGLQPSMSGISSSAKEAYTSNESENINHGPVANSMRSPEALGRDTGSPNSSSHQSNSPPDNLFVPQELNTPKPARSDYEKPQTYSDFEVIDLTVDDDNATQDQLFTEGIVILRTNKWGGQRYLNQYGPKNSAIALWSSSAAPQEVENCTHLKGSPHVQALDMHKDGDHIGKPKYRLMVNRIKMVAWQPPDDGSTMLDLVNSVEALNPEKKSANQKYTFPFTTILVEFKEEVGLPPVWIGRADLQKLTSSAKGERAKLNNRIYRLALHQVRNYKNWAGNLLDDNWKGERREGIDKSPSPEERLLEKRSHSPQDKQSQLEKQSNHENTRETTATTQHGEEPQEPEEEAVGHQNITDQERTDQEAVSEKQKHVVDIPISRSFKGFCAKNKIKIAPANWRDIPDPEFAKFQVVAEVFIEEQKKYGKRVIDDMEIFEALDFFN